MPKKVRELFRRDIGHGEIGCTLPGGWDDEVNWRYPSSQLTPEDLAPIEAVLAEFVRPENGKIGWRISMLNDKFYAGWTTWINPGLSGNTPDELADVLRGYFQKNP